MTTRAELLQRAHALQRQNLWFRKFYGGAMLFFVLLGYVALVIDGTPWVWLGTVFFLALFVLNERMIRRMRVAGIDGKDGG